MRYFLLYISIVVTACTGGTRERDASQADILVPIDTAEFALDNRTSYRTFFVQASRGINKNSELIFLSQHKPSIQFFDINTHKMVNEILLEKDGPNGVGTPEGLLYLSPDSIFVISASHYEVELINSKGIVQKVYRVLEGNKYNDNTGLIRPYTTSAPVLINNKIYFNVAPDRDVYKASYFEGHVNLVLDLKTGEYE